MSDYEGKTRYCSYCKERHPVEDFTNGQYVCKIGRKAQQQKNAEFNINNPQKDDYEKRCTKCGELQNAKVFFPLDKSRPDGYFIWCKKCEKISRGRKKIYNTSLMIGLPVKFREQLLKTILKTIKDTDRSITRQIVEDFRHEGEKVSFTGREWQIQILNDLRPHVVVRKPSQQGLTWLYERFMIALLMRYENRPYRYKDHTGAERSRFIEGIYSFETATKASRWSKVRLKKLKYDNPHIQDALKVGETDSALLMKFGRTALHLVGRATVSGVLTISGDIVIIDEKDRDVNTSVAAQLGSRTLESEFMKTTSTKGIVRETSTPEVSGAGISLQYENSDQAEWEIYCVKCGRYQVLTYPECIGNFYDRDEAPLTDNDGTELTPYWRCMYCHEPIDWTTIGKWNSDDPDYYENARWVIRKPKNYNPFTGKGICGYQVPFASPQRTAAFFLAERDDPERDIVYLHNHMLGLPYDDMTKTLASDNFHIYHDFTWGFVNKERYVLGCDHHPRQGGYIVICRQIRNTMTAVMPEGKWVVVYMEHVKNNRELWDDVETIRGVETIKKGRLFELITEYNISVAVIDLEPDTNEVEKLIKQFAFSRQVWSNKSGRQQDSFTWTETEIVDNKEKVVCRMHEDKVAAIDYYFNKIRFGDILFLEKGKYPNPNMQRQFVQAHMNLYKGETTTALSKTAGVVQKRVAALNIQESYKKRVAGIHDHWVMAGKFGAQGIRMINKIKFTNRHIAPPQIHTMDRIPGT